MLSIVDFLLYPFSNMLFNAIYLVLSIPLVNMGVHFLCFYSMVQSFNIIFCVFHFLTWYENKFRPRGIHFFEALEITRNDF